jgi:excisionase family DNA binding protein
VSPRDRLATLLAPGVLDVLDAFVAERVREELAAVGPAEHESPWLSLADGSAYLGISERQLQRAITRGKLPSTTIGRRRLLHRDDLDRFARAAGEE